MRVGGLHHVVAFRHGNGHGLLAEDVASRRRGIHRDIAMRGVGGDDGDRVAVALVEKRPIVRPVRDVAIVAEAAGLATVGVGHADQFNLWLPIDQLAGIGAEASRAHKRDPKTGRSGSAATHNLISAITYSPRLGSGSRPNRRRV